MSQLNKKGFTLVELMVVLAILGLLAGIGIPQYTKVMERARIGRDIAAIAIVQSAVNAFVAEIGGTITAKAMSTGTEQPREISDITGVSVLTGVSVDLTDCLEGALPKLESAEASAPGAQWYVSDRGRVFIGASSNAEILPTPTPKT